jgi:hypothetical protein
MTLRDRKKPDTDVGATSSAPHSPPKPRQVRTPSRTPQSSPPKPQQASASHRKIDASGPPTTSSDSAQSEKPNSSAGHSPYHAALTENELVPHVARSPKSGSEGLVSPVPVDVTVAPPTTEARRPLMIRIKLPPRAKSSEVNASAKTDPLASVTDPLPPSE